MSDTIQVVCWALAQNCRVRRGEKWEHPSTALGQVSDLKLYSSYKNRPEGDNPIFDGICVTRLRLLSAEGFSMDFRYPESGLILSSAFSSYGGVKAVEEMCGNCHANSGPGELAACAGSFHFSRTDQKGRAQLDRIIERLGLREEVERLFPKAKILSCRFWMRSSLSKEATIVLHRILKALYEEDVNSIIIAGKTYPSRHTEELGEFVRALERSLSTGINMWVFRTPPGHTDFGRYTTFAHCPRCKEEAPLERWTRKISDDVIICDNCGESYSPKATYSSVRDPDQDAEPELRDVLGQEAFEKFAIQFMLSRGISENAAADHVKRIEADTRKRKEENARQLELGKRNRLYVREQMLVGLKNISKGEMADEPDWLLSVDDFRTFLARCCERAAEVFLIFHISESGDKDQTIAVKSEGREPIATLEQMIADGFRERFRAHVRVPDELVDAWWKLRNVKESSNGG